MKRLSNLVAAMVVFACLVGCSSHNGNVQRQSMTDAEIYWGTIVEATDSYQAVQTVNSSPSVAGGVLGGVLGHQFGKGNGKKAMSFIGVISGAEYFATNRVSTRMAPSTAVVIREERSGEQYRVMLDGDYWRRGMKVRFSLFPSTHKGSEFDLVIR